MDALRRFRTAAQAGFTLVEIMIGLLIGVIGIVIIMQVYAVSESYKRTATSGTDAQSNGAVALYLIEREIRLAGYGMNSMIPSGCTTVRVWNDNTGTGMDLRMTPFEINPAGVPAGDANTDVLLISYGSSDNFVSGVSADQSSNSSANFTVKTNRDGFRAGDLVVAYQPGAGPGGTDSCVLNELTGVPGANGNCNGSSGSGGSDVLTHNTGKYKNPNDNCEDTTAVHNNSSGIKDADGNTVPALNSTSGGQLFDLGGLPQVKIYAIHGGNLTGCDMLNKDCTNLANYDVLVNDVVSLRAAYGEDFDGVDTPTTTLGDGKVDRWSRAALVTKSQISRVLAASVQVTARSALKEKPSNGGTTCDATLTASRPDRGQTTDWYQSIAAMQSPSGTLASGAIDLSATSADWKCYRYKLFQTSVPLRNMIWRP
jgi:type IV pilus assembly protein PilW